MKKNDVWFAAGLGLAQLALLSTAARAQDSTRVLKQVVVTATRSPKKLSDIGRVVSVITADQIAKSQGKTLPGLLNTVPGITFSGADNNRGLSSDIYLRGASAGNTLVLVDGFPVNDASGIAGNYDLNAFPLDQIDHIEILKGSGSTLFGSDAVAGVINIITKHPSHDGLKASAQLSGGSYNTFSEAAGVNGKVKNTGIAINLSNTDSRGFSAATDTLRKGGFKNDGFHQHSASINLNQQVSRKFVLNGNLQLTNNTGDLPFGAFTNDINYTYNNTFLIAGLGAKLQLPKGVLNFNVSQNNVWNHYKNLLPDNDSTYQVTINKGRITNAEAVLNYGLGRHFDITSGAGFKYSQTDQYGKYKTIGYAPPISLINANANIASAYTSLFYKSDIFHMELGGRYNHHNKYGDNFTYTINPSLLLADRFKVFATVASAFKTPTLYQLYSQYGNLQLKPERTTSYEAGFDLELISDMLSINTVFYKREIKDVVYFYTDASFVSYYKNGFRQNDKGFESELNFHSKAITVEAFAAYVTGFQIDAAGKQKHNLYRRPKNSYGVNVAWNVIKDFSVGVNYKYNGDRQDQDFNHPPYPAIVTLKNYSLVDAHLQFIANKQLTLFADLKNLFDEKYTDWLGYNTRGFNFMAGLRYQFN
jgi:vitamin B12 transporter